MRILLSLFVVFSFASISNAFVLRENMVIVRAKNDHASNIAANDLSYYLEKITRTKPLILDEVPENNASVSLIKLPVGRLKDDGFIIKSDGDDLVIIGSNDRSLLYGVFYFLDRYLGCKFLAENFEYVPEYKSRDLGEIYDKQEPRFSYREIFIKESDDPVFSIKNLLNGRLGHRTKDDIAEEIYTKGIKLYTFTSEALLGEKYKCSGQYDFSNKKAKKLASETLGQKLKTLDQEAEKYIVLEHEDRGSVCKKGVGGKRSPSSLFLDYTSYIAKEHPGYRFLHQAYLWSKKPPLNHKKLPENLGVLFAPIEADFSKPIHSKRNGYLHKYLKRWGKKSDEIFIWHYITNFGGYIFPYPNLNALDRDIKDFSKKKYIKGLFLQGSYDTYAGELANLRVWVFAKLLWNPSLKIEDLIEEFCDYYYDKASRDVQRYIKTVERMLKKSGDKLFVKTSINAKYLSNENLNELDAILSEGASKLDKESIYYDHLQALFLGIDYIRLIRGDSFDSRKRVKERFKAYLQRHPEITSFSESVKIDDIFKIIDIDRTNERIPKPARNLERAKEWFSYQEYQLELCCADIVKDSAASDGVSAVMDGKSREWGFSLPLLDVPEGKWDVYAEVRIQKRSDDLIDKAKKALHYGIYPTFIKGIALIGQFDDKYRSIKIGTIDTKKTNAKSVWLSPPGNDAVEKVYLDRIYFIKHQRKIRSKKD